MGTPWGPRGRGRTRRGDDRPRRRGDLVGHGVHGDIRTAMRRLGGADEVADAVLFLASDEASYNVGETLRVDGGWTAYQLFQGEIS